MFIGTYIFSQIMRHLPRHDFDKCIARYDGEHYAKNFSCRDQFLAMAFGQLAYRESLRDICACLKSHHTKLYHLGFGGTVALQTLAGANQKRDWRIYRDLATLLIHEARKLYVDEPKIAEDIKGSCYAVDSTTIDLCLSLFHWAPYVPTKAAVKLHMVMDIRGSIPTFFDITNGKVNDVNFLDKITFEKESFYVLDRGYVSFKRLYTIHMAGSFFVTRAKDNMKFKRRYSKPTNRGGKSEQKITGVICDQIITLAGKLTAPKYPTTVRRIKYRDPELLQEYVFLTNNFEVSAESIALLYKNSV